MSFSVLCFLVYLDNEFFCCFMCLGLLGCKFKAIKYYYSCTMNGFSHGLLPLCSFHFLLKNRFMHGLSPLRLFHFWLKFKKILWCIHSIFKFWWTGLRMMKNVIGYGQYTMWEINTINFVSLNMTPLYCVSFSRRGACSSGIQNFHGIWFP